MRTRFNIILISILVIVTIIVCGLYLTSSNHNLDKKIQKIGQQDSAPPCLKMYNLIEFWSDNYDIPKHILYNVAYLETRYRGPFDWTYNPELTSSAGAVGPMQIIPRFAHKFAGRKVTAKELRTNMELNIMVSCKMLVSLFKTYKRWDLALGFYNTGYPRVNDYAKYGSETTNYKINWINNY